MTGVAPRTRTYAVKVLGADGGGAYSQTLDADELVVRTLHRHRPRPAEPERHLPQTQLGELLADDGGLALDHRQLGHRRHAHRRVDEVLVDRTLTGGLSDLVSSSGEVRVRVRCTSSTQAFSGGDLVRLTGTRP